MKISERMSLLSMSIASVVLAAAPAAAQQITGVPGSPSATTTIDGEQLPPPPAKFGGKIERNAAQSKPYWPARVVPPKGAPNVLLIMTDDVGFGAPSTFGGVIPTPALDRIANNGLRYTNFHSTALCSPTRAALITGRNHHSAGFGVISEQATGFPGYDSVHHEGQGDDRHASCATTATAPRGSARTTTRRPSRRARSGRSTSGRPAWASSTSTASSAATRTSGSRQPVPQHDAHLPLPRTTRLEPDHRDGRRRHRVHEALNTLAPEQPFFVYYVPGGTHAPHHPTPEWIEKISDMHLFDKGWNALREQIFANQKKLGVIPQNAKLTPWPDDLLKHWDALSDDEKKMFIRQVDVYAAYLAYTDHEIGRVIQAVEDMGKLDNTLIIYISGDNGASAEGTLERHAERGRDVQRRRGAGRRPAQVLLRRLGLRQDLQPHGGAAGPGPSTRRSRGPSRSPSHFGGTRQGMAISWPAVIKDKGGIRNQFHHVIDIVPTILEATGIPAPKTVDGIAQSPIEGVSMAYTFDKANAERAVAAPHAVLRDDGRPRDLPRRLDREHEGRSARRG